MDSIAQLIDRGFVAAPVSTIKVNNLPRLHHLFVGGYVFLYAATGYKSRYEKAHLFTIVPVHGEASPSTGSSSK